MKNIIRKPPRTGQLSSHGLLFSARRTTSVIRVTAFSKSLELGTNSPVVTTVTANTPSLAEDNVFVGPAFC